MREHRVHLNLVVVVEVTEIVVNAMDLNSELYKANSVRVLIR